MPIGLPASREDPAQYMTSIMLKMHFLFLINNSYFCVGKQVFRQKIGIPMGLDPTPFLANLFLAYYEIHFIDRLKKNGLW